MGFESGPGWAGTATRALERGAEAVTRVQIHGRNWTHIVRICAARKQRSPFSPLAGPRVGGVNRPKLGKMKADSGLMRVVQLGRGEHVDTGGYAPDPDLTVVAVAYPVGVSHVSDRQIEGPVGLRIEVRQRPRPCKSAKGFSLLGMARHCPRESVAGLGFFFHIAARRAPP
jgi:hypothetical protein